MKNKSQLLYGATGLLIGILITTCYVNFIHKPATDKDKRSQTPVMTHQMPMDMNSTMEGMTSGLNGITGDAFDKEFLKEMIIHHQGAVTMAQAVLKNSKRPELIRLANDIISAQTEEITKMESWQKAWFVVQK